MGATVSRFETVAAVMAAEAAKPYSLGGMDGATDCLIIGLRVVDALRGTDFAAEAVGLYADEAGVRRELRKRKYRGFGGIFAKHIGLDSIAAAMARIGDIAIVERVEAGRMAEHVAVFTGKQFLTRTDSGPVSFGFDAVKACFKV